MALSLVESLSTAEEDTLIHRLLATMLQQVIDAGVTAVIGAGHQRQLQIPRSKWP